MRAHASIPSHLSGRFAFCSLAARRRNRFSARAGGRFATGRGASTAPTRHSCTGSVLDSAGLVPGKSGIWILWFRPVKTAKSPCCFARARAPPACGSAPGAVRGGARPGPRGRGGRAGGRAGRKAEIWGSSLATNASAPKQGPVFWWGGIPGSELKSASRSLTLGPARRLLLLFCPPGADGPVCKPVLAF